MSMVVASAQLPGVSWKDVHPASHATTPVKHPSPPNTAAAATHGKASALLRALANLTHMNSQQSSINNNPSIYPHDTRRKDNVVTDWMQRDGDKGQRSRRPPQNITSKGALLAEPSPSRTRIQSRSLTRRGLRASSKTVEYAPTLGYIVGHVYSPKLLFIG